MTPSSDDRLGAIRERCEKATPGPWRVWNGPSYVGGGRDLCIGAGEDWIANMDERRCPTLQPQWGDQEKHDSYTKHDPKEVCPICSLEASDITTEQGRTASFIAHSREDIPWLLEQLRAARAALAGALKLHGRICYAADGSGKGVYKCEECGRHEPEHAEDCEVAQVGKQIREAIGTEGGS